MTAPTTSSLAALDALAGRWTGTSRLYMPWTTPAESDSTTTAEVRPVAGGRFVTIAYTWSYDGKPCEGFLLAGRETKTDVVNAVWVDSWHQREHPLASTGGVSEGGGIDVRGSYPAPTGPDWGWRTTVLADGADAFRIVMYNISPEGEEMLAFENRYTRAS